jgi:hypothetical protein
MMGLNPFPGVFSAGKNIFHLFYKERQMDDMMIAPELGDRQHRLPGNNEDGFVLIVAMMMLVVITLMGMSMSNTSTTEIMIAGNARQSQDQFYTADAGINAAVAQNIDPTAAAVVPNPAAFTCAGVPGNGAAPFTSFNIDGNAGNDVFLYVISHKVNTGGHPEIRAASCAPAGTSVAQIITGIEYAIPPGGQNEPPYYN